MSDSIEEIDRKTLAWLEDNFVNAEETTLGTGDFHSVKAAHDLGIPLEEFYEIFYIEDLRDLDKLALHKKYVDARNAAKESIYRVITVTVNKEASGA